MADPNWVCPNCQSKGFERSLLWDNRCEFCDGTFGGNPPTPEEIKAAQKQTLSLKGWFEYYLRYDAQKHDLNGDQDLDEYINDRVNRMSLSEFLEQLSNSLDELMEARNAKG
jgi:hypothetical protein